MAFLSLKKLLRSFQYASVGIATVFREEQNFRLHVIAALLVITLMFLFRVTMTEMLFLIFAIMSVMVLEVMNSIIEKIVDVLKPRIHPYVERIKDMMAAAVLLASLGALGIGVIIFAPYIERLFRS